MTPPDSSAAALTPPYRVESERASELLEELHDAFPNDTVTVGELIDRLNGRAIGLLLLILALPMCIPNVPGISTIFGFLLIAPGVQMVAAGGKLWLPRRVQTWSFSREGLQRAIKAAAPYLRRIEKFVQPRLTWLSRPPFTMLFGLQVLVMAGVLMLPIPFGNWPPAMSLAIMALGLLQRDGVLLLLSVPAALVSIAIAYIGVRIGWAALHEFGEIVHRVWVSLFGG